MGGKVSLRVQQIDVDVETKTQDNVFVIFQVSIQYKVLEEHDDLIHGNTTGSVRHGPTGASLMVPVGYTLPFLPPPDSSPSFSL
eukprot:NODE_6631_length_443_cov_119.035533_g5059_i0.p1 GENE.NODE_6631_length_443_cov_119.035533_g5059_i0~~NODE_6631_length_443_cov_119.035533_g5059_i0.p1  ORF type:complete len:91 (+),score=20.47 NODE_6631_length_443_cov_119.035533_g5059_i0:24-275(+)